MGVLFLLWQFKVRRLPWSDPVMLFVNLSPFFFVELCLPCIEHRPKKLMEIADRRRISLFYIRTI